MSLTFQMIMAFVIVAAALVVAAVFLKKTRAVWIIAAAFLVPAAAATIVTANFVAANPADELKQARLVEEKDKNPDDYINMATALLTKGMTRSAEQTLNDFAARYPVNDAYMLARARLDALRGSYQSAQGILATLKSSGEFGGQIEKEANALAAVLSGSLSHNELVQTVMEGIDALSLPDNATRAAAVYAKVDRMDAATASSGEAADAAEEYQEILNDYPATAFPPAFETSYLKALDLSGQYPEIVARSDKYSDASQYLMLGEVVRENHVTEEDLKEVNVLSEQRGRNERIIQWLEQQKASQNFGEDVAVLDGAIEKLHDSSTDSVDSYKAWVREQIRTAADTPGERESSKLYLELAYMNYTDGSDEETAALIRKALVTAADSDDAAYLQPAGRLNEILENKDDTEAYKEIDRYVKVLVDNMQAEEMKANAGADANIDLSDFADEVTDTLTGEDDTPATAADDGDSSSEDDATADGTFSGYVSEQVNQITASINIASIDHSNFEQMSAVIAIDESVADSAEEFKQKIDLYDCDIAVKDYQVEKLNDAGVNIVLVCDNSGSMGDGGKIDDLKDALRRFADNLDSDTKAGTVAFSSGFNEKGSVNLGASVDQLKRAIDEMDANGGTNIYSGVEQAMQQFTKGDAVNVLIVLSDGQDSTPNDNTLKELQMACADRGVMIYSMGLGSDADSAVLSAYSSTGGGSYTHVSNADSLLSFYNYLYKISRNRFRVSYTAQDTIQTDRMLRAEYHDDTKVFDEKKYRLYDNADLDSDNVGENYSLALEGVTLGGLDTRLLYKSSVDQTVHLLGDRLKKDLDLKVSIKAGTTYDLSCAYESDTSWCVTIPAAASCGEYDVVVTVNGKRAVFQSGLVITSDKLNVVRFGQYIFEASSVGSAQNETTLSGYVRMNGWLGFNGTVTLRGDLKHDDSVTMTAGKSFVSYKKGAADLNKLAAFMAEHGVVLNFRGFSDLKLYRNDNVAPSDESFRVEPVKIDTGLVLPGFLYLSTPGMSLYPDRMSIDFREFNTKLPFQDKLLIAGDVPLFDYSLTDEEKMIVSQSAIDCDIEIGVNGASNPKGSIKGGSGGERTGFFGNMRMALNLDEFNLKINTAENNYSFKIMVDIAMIDKGLGLEIAWADGAFDTAKIYADFDVDTVISGVPVTFSDFSLGVSGLKDGIQNMMLEGGCKVSFVKISKFLPGLETYLGDFSVLSLEDVSLALRFGKPYIKLEATLNFLEEVELGHAKLELGLGIPYSNEMIHYDDESVNGIVGEVGTGIKVDTDRIKIDIGTSGQLALTDKVMAATAGGKCNYDIDLWIVGAKSEFEGKVFVGCYQKHNGKPAFAIIVRKDTSEIARFEWDINKVIA